MSSVFLMLPIDEMNQAVQDTTAAVMQGAEAGKELQLWELTKSGGWWIMLPLAGMMVFAIYVFIERFLAIQKATKDESLFMNNIRDMIHEGKIESARDLCKTQDSPLTKMIGKGLSRLGRPMPDINQAIETVGKLEVSKLEKNVASLATISGAAPMIGFLGTVTGMVKVFFDMAQGGNSIQISTLSDGMYQAMVTTIAGLIVGVLAYIAYNVIVARIEKVVFILEARATEFMDVLHEPAK